MIRIDKSLCTGCGNCAAACAFFAIDLLNVAVPNNRCTDCGLCVTSCPVNAISAFDKTGLVPSLGGTLIAAQMHDGRVMDVSLALCQKARELNAASGAKTFAALFGSCAGAQAQRLIDHGADTVYVCIDSRLDALDDGLHADTLCAVIERAQPAAVLFGATDFGRSLAPRVAARHGAGLTADCTGLALDDQTGLLLQTRPAFGGNLMATIVCPVKRPQMAGVRPGVFPVKPAQAAQNGRIVRVPVPEGAASFYEILSSVYNPPAKGIADAGIVVTAGRGIGGIKNMNLVHDFADRIGAKVAVTRPLVDAGYGEAHQQIGQTGQAVAPKLLIALGVSGAIQHLAGMRGAKTVVAVNSDPDAPIFAVADYALVGDCVEILRSFLAYSG